MSRKIVAVKETVEGRKPDYSGGYDDAVYWDSGRAEADDLSKGEVSIIPHS